MDSCERYLFDTQGCLVLPDLLSADEVRGLIAGIPRRGDGAIICEQDAVTFGGLLDYEEPLFRELIAHPRIVPYLRAVLTGHDQDPEANHIQLSHEYGLAMHAGQTGPWFHNGGTPHRPWLAYHAREGRIHCALVCVVWMLTDVGPGDGGFWYIPGSHKAAFPLPDEIRTYATVPPCVVQPAARAGSAILFTEALTHGTRTWSATHQRLALFYKYMPGLMAHQRSSPSRPLTAEQQEYLRASGLRPT
jgi:hypothetical protein